MYDVSAFKHLKKFVVATLCKDYDNNVLMSERFESEDDAVMYLMQCRFHHPEHYHYVYRRD